MTRVLKFGGSSIADASCMRAAAELVEEALPEAPVVVLSAMGDTTDELFQAARQARDGDLEASLATLEGTFGRHLAAARGLFEGALPAPLGQAFDGQRGELQSILQGVSLLRELSSRSMDALAAHGERLSTRLFAAHLGAREHDVRWLDARELVPTDDAFGHARPRRAELAAACAARLAPQTGPGRIVVTQGYVGATDQGVTTTLGRGGSDYSAALFAAALGADELQIWTDVEGVYTADPRAVPEASPIAELSFAEAAELAAFGARVLHPATLQPAVEVGIPVTVRHTRRPHGRFTTIRDSVASGRPVTALASRGPITVLTLTSTRMLAASGYLARLFEVFGRHDVSVDLVATAEVSVSLSVEADAPIERLRAELERIATVQVFEGRAIVAVVGERLKQTSGVAGRALVALADVNVEMISMGANEINLSLVVRSADVPSALTRLHRAFFEST